MDDGIPEGSLLTMHAIVLLQESKFFSRIVLPFPVVDLTASNMSHKISGLSLTTARLTSGSCPLCICF